LLPDGALPVGGLHPLESAAFARRTPRTDSDAVNAPANCRAIESSCAKSATFHQSLIAADETSKKRKPARWLPVSAPGFWNSATETFLKETFSMPYKGD
jgi:hypothetical protein